VLRILVADDHASIRRLICRLLDAEEDWKVCGEAKTGVEAVEMTNVLKPDLVVLDLSMPLLHGLDAASQIVSKRPATAVLLLTLHELDGDLRRAALASGASSYLLKTDMDRLPAEIRRLMRLRSG
jgi:two-component system, NarL family, nitrate/nitrite response regulator NarL